MNQCHFLGNLTRDPELRLLQGDKKVVQFGIAVNRHFKRGNQWAKETAYLDCEAWDTGAANIAERFKKGDPIIVHGSIKQDEWEDKETGKKRTKLKLRVERFQALPGHGKRAEQDTNGTSPGATNNSAASWETEDNDVLGNADDNIAF